MREKTEGGMLTQILTETAILVSVPRDVPVS